MAEDDERGEDFVVLTILAKGCTFNYVVIMYFVYLCLYRAMSSISP